VEDQVIQVFAATNGFLDRIRVERVPEFLDQLVERFHSEHEDLLGKIRESDWSDETQDAVRKGVAEFGDDFGYDLDEEGHAIEDSDVGETTRESEGIRGRNGGDGDQDARGDADDAEAEETQEAAATA
jgi:F-type H+-transporting ATPase subunit alpha